MQINNCYDVRNDFKFGNRKIGTLFNYSLLICTPDSYRDNYHYFFGNNSISTISQSVCPSNM
jgi:hypothetical protein